MHASIRSLFIPVLTSALIGGLGVQIWNGLKHPRPRAPASVSDTHVVLILIDGLDAASFEEERLAGRLPEISKLIESGTYYPKILSSFPSVTGYTYFPYLTGRPAIESGVLGLRWFDRARFEAGKRGAFRHYVGATSPDLALDLDPRTPTLFERFPNDKSFSVNTFLDRGSTQSHSSGVGFALSKLEHGSLFLKILGAIPLVGSHLIPSLESVDRKLVDDVIKKRGLEARVTWITFATPDAYVHMKGFGKKQQPTYRRLLQNIDRQIGRLRHETERLGLSEKTLYAVISDHGVTPVDRNVDLCKVLNKSKLSCLRGPSITANRNFHHSDTSVFQKYHTLVAVNGNTMAYVHVLDQTLKNSTKTALLNESGVEHVFSKLGDSSAIEVLTRFGRSEIEALPHCIRYAHREGLEPLGVPEKLSGSCRPKDEWIRLTLESDFPGAISRIAELLSHPSSGDFVVTAQAGYDFGKDFEIVQSNYRGGHGGLRRDQILVPAVLSSKNVSQTLLTAEDVGRELHTALGITSGRPQESTPSR